MAKGPCEVDMIRVEIIAGGDVQRVGFRDAVWKIARNLGLSGTVQNLEPYDVSIVAEGEEAALKEFVKAIKIQAGPIRVQTLKENWSAATGEFPYFKILRGDWQEELGERFDVAVGLMRSDLHENANKRLVRIEEDIVEIKRSIRELGGAATRRDAETQSLCALSTLRFYSATNSFFYFFGYDY